MHLDVMDGHFVDNISFGPAMVETVDKSVAGFLDAHLMISRPDHYLPRFLAAGADPVTVHAEADHDVAAALAWVVKPTPGPVNSGTAAFTVRIETRPGFPADKDPVPAPSVTLPVRGFQNQPPT